MIKKILALCFLLVAINGIFAVSFEYRQQRVIADTMTKDLGNVILYDQVQGDRNLIYFAPENNYTYDLRIDVTNFNEPIYIKFNNPTNEDVESITWARALLDTLSFWNDPTELENHTKFEIFYLDTIGFGNTQLRFQEFFLLEEGDYYFKLSPTGQNQHMTFFLNFEDDIDTNVYLINQKPTGFNNYIYSFINSLNGLIELNINIWKLVYYTFIVGIIINSIIGLILMILKLLEWTKDISMRKVIIKDNKRRKK